MRSSLKDNIKFSQKIQPFNPITSSRLRQILGKFMGILHIFNNYH